MRPFAAATLALSLGGCAHLLPPKPAWQCFAQAEVDGVRALSWRMLDRAGREIEAREEWMRGFQPRPRDFYATYWVHKGPPARAADGEVVLRLAPDFRPIARYRLELRGGSPDGDALAAGKLDRPDAQPELRLPWSQMGLLLSSGVPLFLVASDGTGARRDSQPVPLAVFRTGFALVQRAAVESRHKAERFEQNCQLHQEIIVT